MLAFRSGECVWLLGSFDYFGIFKLFQFFPIFLLRSSLFILATVAFR